MLQAESRQMLCMLMPHAFANEFRSSERGKGTGRLHLRLPAG